MELAEAVTIGFPFVHNFKFSHMTEVTAPIWQLFYLFHCREISIFTRKMARGLIFFKVSKGEKIRNRYIQVPHLTQDTNGKVIDSQLDTQTSYFSALSSDLIRVRIRNRYNKIPHLT